MLEGQGLGESTIRLLVADASRIHTQLLVEALRRDPELFVTAFELDSSSLVVSVKDLNIHVLIMSSTLDEQPGRGFEMLRELRSETPKLRVVMLLDSSTDEAIIGAFRAGARGVLSKKEPAHILNQCVRHVHEGHIWANSRQLTIAIEALATSPVVRAVNARGMNLLSKRELQVVRSLAEGLTNREIAERLKLSQHTVKNYLFRVFDKLGVSSRVELLFMTLADAEIQPARKNLKRPDHGGSGEEFGLFLKAAQAGLPPAQLALAQMYVFLQKEPEDLIQAYAWYLLAVDRAAQAKQQIIRTMTVKQMDDAQQCANLWLARLQAIDPPPESQAAKPSTLSPPMPSGKKAVRTKGAAPL